MSDETDEEELGGGGEGCGEKGGRVEAGGQRGHGRDALWTRPTTSYLTVLPTPNRCLSCLTRRLSA